MKKVAIVQSNYIPWKGYFDLIAAVDEFVIYDDVQFTKNDWRNRNKIKTPKGTEWISIPVGKDINRLICEVQLPKNNWQTKHWSTIELNYRRAPFFNEVGPILKDVLLGKSHSTLTSLNLDFIEKICNYLEISTRISYSWELSTISGQTERLADICRKLHASHYITGPAARNYLDEDIFEAFGISISYFDYSGYQEYPQLWGGFEHSVSIIDLLFNCGPESRKYLQFMRRVG